MNDQDMTFGKNNFYTVEDCKQIVRWCKTNIHYRLENNPRVE